MLNSLRAQASRKADEEKEGEIDIIGGIGSLLKGIVGFVSGAVEGLSRAAGDKVTWEIKEIWFFRKKY